MSVDAGVPFYFRRWGARAIVVVVRRSLRVIGYERACAAQLWGQPDRFEQELVCVCVLSEDKDGAASVVQELYGVDLFAVDLLGVWME